MKHNSRGYNDKYCTKTAVTVSRLQLLMIRFNFSVKTWLECFIYNKYWQPFWHVKKKNWRVCVWCGYTYSTRQVVAGKEFN